MKHAFNQSNRLTNATMHRRTHTVRSGSAIVLCFLAMAVLSLASISIVRSHRRANIRASSVRDQVEGRLIAEGLIHRNVAIIRANGGASRIEIDPAIRQTRFSSAWMPPPVVDAETVTMQVFLYDGATQPAAAITTSLRQP